MDFFDPRQKRIVSTWRKEMKLEPDQKSDISQILEADKPPIYRRVMKRWGLLVLLVVVAVTTLVIWKRQGDSNSMQYRTEEAVRGNLKVIVIATGTLKPTNSVDVGTELSGTVKDVEVDYNSKVKVGQVLARLDTTKLKETLTQSRAALESAKAKVLQAQATVNETRSKLKQLQRVWKLSNGKVPSQSDIDAAKASFERAKADEASAKAGVSQAEATVQANETDISKSVIRSPINGIVLTRSIEPGQTVAASYETPLLFTLAEDLTKMELHVNVDEADIGKVREGQKATFSVAAYPNKTFEAQITQTRYGSSTTSGVVTYETVLKVDNSDLSLRPGMTATADITVRKVENAILIPSAVLRFAPQVPEEETPSTGLIGALLPHAPSPESKQNDNVFTNKNQQRVWTLKDGKLSAVPVKVGSTDGSMTEIVNGDIKVGMALVVDTINVGK
jgi:HlyD family secretion protein